MRLSRPRRRVACLWLGAVLAGLGSPSLGWAQRGHLPPDALAQLGRVPAESKLAQGRLRVINLYKPQAELMFGDSTASVAEVAAQMRQTVYVPHADFWNAYVGSESGFDSLATTVLLPHAQAFSGRLQGALATNLDSLFTSVSRWVTITTKRPPRGTWYLVLGFGVTSAGALRNGTMVMDLNALERSPDEAAALLAHELTHEVDTVAVSAPSAGTVLARIIREGLASYADFAFGEGFRTEASTLFYSGDEYEAAVAHEAQLQQALRPLLGSRDPKDLARVTSRSTRLVAGGPSAAGYFIGFRIVSAYVARHGPKSWADLIGMPPREVLRRSGYPLQ